MKPIKLKLSKKIFNIIFFISLLVGNSTIYTYASIESENHPKEEYLDKKTNFDYILGQGDTLKVIIDKNLGYLTNFYIIDGNGSITLPKINNIFVSGLTINELQELLNKRFEGILLKPNVKVEVAHYRPIRFYISGEVEEPGMHILAGSFGAPPSDILSTNNSNPKLLKDINKISAFQERQSSLNRRDLSERIGSTEYIARRQLASANLAGPTGYFPTLFDAIKVAKGITPYSNLTNIEIVRKNTLSNGGGLIRTKVNFLKVIEDGDQSQNIRIADGDVIKVSKSSQETLVQLSKAMMSNLNPKEITVFVSGRVEKPGILLLTKSSTVNDALLMSGLRALRGPITLLRIKKDGTMAKTRFRYNKNSKRGSTSNQYLKSGDILAVNKSGFNIAAEIIEEATSPFAKTVQTYMLYEILTD